jgi:hypothetical protein
MGNSAHRSRGRLEDLRLVACIMADMEDLSTSCAAQMEEIDSSKEVGSSTSAGIRVFKSSTVRFGLEVEVGWVDVDSESGNGDPWRDGVSNLTTGFAYGWGRLCDKTSQRKTGFEGKELTRLDLGVEPSQPCSRRLEHYSDEMGISCGQRAGQNRVGN